MIIYNDVKSTTRLPDLYYDDYHVYVVKQQTEVSENVGSVNEFVGYKSQVTIYTKDEYIIATSKQLNGLSFRVDEDNVLVVVTPD